MESFHAAMLLGHTTGLADSCYGPNDQELLNDYLKAVSDLSLECKPQVEIAEGIEELKHERDSLREELSQFKAKLPNLVNAQINKLFNTPDFRTVLKEALKKAEAESPALDNDLGQYYG